MKSQKGKGLVLAVATTLLLGCFGTVALASVVNPNNAILNGTYQGVGQVAGFSQGEGWVNADLYGENVTVTFDGIGSCTTASDGYRFNLSLLNNPTPILESTSETDASITCSYDVSDDGTVTLIDEGGPVSLRTNPTGTIILFGGAEEYAGDPSGTNYETNQFVAIKVAATPTMLKGTFHVINQDAGFWAGSTPGGDWLNAALYGGGGTFTFNGTSGCTFTYADSDYQLDLVNNPDGAVRSSSSSDSGTCTYVSAADGKVTVTMGKETFEFLISSDGNVVLQGGAQNAIVDSGGGLGYEASQMFAVKAGSTMTKASLQGTFHMTSQDTSFWSSTPAGNASTNLYGNETIAYFNGAGGCSYEYEGASFHLSLSQTQLPTISSNPDISGNTCTYTVAANGAVTITDPDGSEKFWLSANGSTLIQGGAKKITESDGTVYNVSQSVGIKTNPYIGVNEAPAAIIVPEADPDGNYLVEWVGGETGITYVLQESKDPTFTTGVRTAYKGKNLSVKITLRPKGQSYYYQVRTEKAGYQPSAWTIADFPCNVGTPLLPAKLTVPAKDADGTYIISWTPSKTPEAYYVLEEATDSAFTTPTEIYSGYDPAFGTFANPTGTTYYYRIKVQKKGFNPAESAWRKALNPCKVGVLAPATLTVPVNPSTAYGISWDPSETSGVTKYTWQEATNSKFTLGLRTFTTTETSVPISGRKIDKTYYYRVRAVKPNYPASPWTATGSCTIVAGP